MNTNYYTQSLDFMESVVETDLFKRMAQTVEDSPWHREANVLVHTQMVFEKYVSLVNEHRLDCENWTHTDWLGAVACLFHDTGKPKAEIVKNSLERGVYRAYHGHELISAHIFQNFAAQRPDLFSSRDVYYIMWMIEHHMPWSIENDNKLAHLAATANVMDSDVYCNALLADQFGRLADDQPSKNKKAIQWVKDFTTDYIAPIKSSFEVRSHNMQTMYIPIGPSGMGKTTLLNLLRSDTIQQIAHYSLDVIRHEIYDTSDYAEAFARSASDSQFEQKAKQIFHQLMDASANDKSIYIDNTNLSAKRRKWYLDIGRRYNMRTVAILAPAPLQLLIDRQTTRSDKSVPIHAVTQQYYSQQSPMYGEFDSVIVCDHNMIVAN